MTPFDRIIRFESAALSVIVYVDENDIIVNNWDVETRECMGTTLVELREWFTAHHPGCVETDITSGKTA